MAAKLSHTLHSMWGKHGLTLSDYTVPQPRRTCYKLLLISVAPVVLTCAAREVAHTLKNMKGGYFDLRECRDVRVTLI